MMILGFLFLTGSAVSMQRYAEVTPVLKPAAAPVKRYIPLWTPELTQLYFTLKNNPTAVGNIFFSGDPGVGKTMSAHMLAGALGVPLYVLDVADVFTEVRGASTRLKAFFDEVYAEAGRTGKQFFVFVDEIDSLVGNYQEGTDQEVRAALNYFLQITQKCDLDPQKKVRIIGATYNRGRLNKAYLSRVKESTIELKLPDDATRRMILTHYIDEKNEAVNAMIQDARNAIVAQQKTPENIDHGIFNKLIVTLVWHYNVIKKDGITQWSIVNLPAMTLEDVRKHRQEKIKKALIDKDVMAAFLSYNQKVAVNRAALIEHLVVETKGYSVRDIISLVNKASSMATEKSSYLMRGEHFKIALKAINEQIAKDKEAVAQIQQGKSNNWKKAALAGAALATASTAAKEAAELKGIIEAAGGLRKFLSLSKFF